MFRGDVPWMFANFRSLVRKASSSGKCLRVSANTTPATTRGTNPAPRLSRRLPHSIFCGCSHLVYYMKGSCVFGCLDTLMFVCFSGGCGHGLSPFKWQDGFCSNFLGWCTRVARRFLARRKPWKRAPSGAQCSAQPLRERSAASSILKEDVTTCIKVTKYVDIALSGLALL